MPYRAVIFDFDGTLVESGPGIFQIMRRVLAQMGLPDVSEEELKPAVGPLLKDAFVQVARVPEHLGQQACDLYHNIYDKEGDGELHTYPGIPQLLDALRRAGIATAVASAKNQRYATLQAERLGLSQKLDLLVGSDVATGRTKKADAIRSIIERLNIPPQHCAMVGDRRFDLDAAREAGVAAIGVLYGYGPRQELEDCRPDHLVDSVAQLQALLLQTNV